MTGRPPPGVPGLELGRAGLVEADEGREPEVAREIAAACLWRRRPFPPPGGGSCPFDLLLTFWCCAFWTWLLTDWGGGWEAAGPVGFWTKVFLHFLISDLAREPICLSEVRLRSSLMCLPRRVASSSSLVICMLSSCDKTSATI